MSEPRFGFKNVVKAKKEGSVKGFFNLRIPTESIGTIEITGFKVVQGNKGLFVSLPNRAVPIVRKQIVETKKDKVEGTIQEIKYYNNIQFETVEKYNEFRDILNKEVLPLVAKELSI